MLHNKLSPNLSSFKQFHSISQFCGPEMEASILWGHQWFSPTGSQILRVRGVLIDMSGASRMVVRKLSLPGLLSHSMVSDSLHGLFSRVNGHLIWWLRLQHQPGAATLLKERGMELSWHHPTILYQSKLLQASSGSREGELDPSPGQEEGRCSHLKSPAVSQYQRTNQCYGIGACLCICLEG